MSAVRRLKSRSEAFWRDEYRVSDADIDLITGMILESSKPQALADLVAAIIARRLERETEAVRFQAEHGALYQPKNSYEIGQQVLFTALDFSTGRVVGQRPGNDPKVGSFQVIRVAFDGGIEREFAAEFIGAHPLNRSAEELLGGTDPEVSDADLARRFELYVVQRLEPALAANPEFVTFNGLWFLRGLLPEVHVGHLNLAEAVIYEAGKPLAARDMVDELEIGNAATLDARLFALSHALGEDQRFDNLGTAENPIWYMRALEPEAVHQRPAVLKSAFRAEGNEHLGITMLELIEEVGDELDALDYATPRERSSFQFQLAFPHFFAGTLPAAPQLLSRLPYSEGTHFPITLVDTSSGQRLQAWAVPAQRYLCGMKEWFTAVGMCVGGQITLKPTEEPGVLEIGVTPMRSKRSEWLRTASVADGALVMQMQRATVDIRADRNMLFTVAAPEEIVGLMAASEVASVSLADLVLAAFQELAKLSSRGIVHAKSIYSAVNCYRRTGCVPVFAELTRRARYDPVGDGFWACSPDVEDRSYRTPELMRERPLSTRTDLVKDQIVQYLG